MVIIQLAGGLGNQMFQYALYLQLKSLGKTVKIDDISGFVEDRQRVPALAAFGAVYEKASRAELERMLDSSPLLHDKIRRKLCGRKKKAYFEADKRYKPEIMEWDDIYLEGYWQTEEYFHDVSEEVKAIFDTDRLLHNMEEHSDSNVILRMDVEAAGKVSSDAFESEKEIELPKGSESENEGNRIVRSSKSRTLHEWLKKIDSTESVSVHVRRGDYLLPENQELFGNICTDEYYYAAMEQMQKEHPGCVFYLFTNDKQWAEGWVADLDRYFIAGSGRRESDPVSVEKSDQEEKREKEKKSEKTEKAKKIEKEITAIAAGNAAAAAETKEQVQNRAARIEIVELDDIPAGGMDRDYAEFLLMSRCRHNILANSSFSWWASYLNRNSHKTVFVPDRWLNGWDCEDFYRADMIKIGTTVH